MTDLIKMRQFAEIAKDRQLTDEEQKELRELLQPYADVLATVVDTMLDAFKVLARALGEAFAAVKNGIVQAQTLNRCPNKRVVHLAKYAKKRRTRKKNLHRAMRIIEEEAKRWTARNAKGI